MSLFIGNLSRRVTSSELEKVFGDYGRCKINFFGKYAFAEFDAERDAEEAVKNLMGMNLSGSNINIEWSKKSRKFDSSKSRLRRSSVSPKRREGRCYNCQSKGHYQKDCR
jgi:RNA recognition motif-containing protein